eukprot:scaffold173072_cov15-Tisochrysis_lutea.AAC.1
MEWRRVLLPLALLVQAAFAAVQVFAVAAAAQQVAAVAQQVAAVALQAGLGDLPAAWAPAVVAPFKIN